MNLSSQDYGDGSSSITISWFQLCVFSDLDHNSPQLSEVMTSESQTAALFAQIQNDACTLKPIFSTVPQNVAYG
jgi:hypothetical protein